VLAFRAGGLLPRHFGLEVVIAKSIARIHWQNLVNFGVLLLTFVNPSDYEFLQLEQTIRITDTASSATASTVLTDTLRR
jgi:aconitate hydratase